MPESTPRPKIVSLVIAVEGGLALLSWVVAWSLDRPLFEKIVFDWEGIVAGLLATLPPYAAMVWSMRTGTPLFGRLRGDIERLVVPLFRGVSTSDMVLIALFAGVGEEVFFRGLLQTGLAGWVGTWQALLLVSILFGVLHWVTAAYALGAGLIGLYLGGFLIASGNLLVPILVHALFDFLALRYLVGRGRAIAADDGNAVGESERDSRGATGGPGRDEGAAPGPPQVGPGS